MLAASWDNHGSPVLPIASYRMLGGFGWPTLNDASIAEIDAPALISRFPWLA